MNGFQQKTIVRAVVAIEKANNGELYRHKLSEWERGLVIDLNDKPESYELTDKQNRCLNEIRQKL